MILDGHIHIMDKIKNTDYDSFNRLLKSAGPEGGLIISFPPTASFASETYHWEDRIKEVMAFTGNDNNLYPIFWIDPTQDDAKSQVDIACEYGILGFKIICDSFYISDEKAMNTVKYIASKEKPILFHSGILWDGKVSSKFNKPVEFESLIKVDGLKFTLAHVSWPWYDECIALYGKFLNAHVYSKDLSVEMFIDLTPGTPHIYRQEVLTKLFNVGYDIENNIIFGTDGYIGNYNASWTENWIKTDNEIYDKLEINEDIRNKIFGENLLRFLGIMKTDIKKKIPVMS